MSVFEVRGPDGAIYEIDAPDEGAALSAFQKHIGGGTSQSEASSDVAVPWHTPITSLPGNAAEVVGGIYNMVRHPLETAKNLEALQQGSARNANSYLSDAGLFWKLPEPTEKEKKNAELASHVGKQIYNNFNTPTRAWNTIATHPLDTLMTVAPGIGQLGKAAEAAGMAKTASVLGKTSAVMDPVNAITKPIEKAMEFGASAIPGQTRGSTALLRNAVPKDTTGFSALGPDAMLLDASPSTVGLAQGAVSAPGPAKDALVEALLAREKGRSSRLLNDAETTLGKASDPEILKKRIAAEANADADPFYKQAKRNPPDLRNDESLKSQLAQELTDPAKGMSMGQRGRNKTIFDEIDDALMADSPQETVSRLHSLRQDLDAAIYDTMNVPSQQRAIAEKARRVVDKVLKERVPGFTEGDQIYSEGQKAIEAVDHGYNSLEGGKGTMFPETFRETLKTHPKEFVAEGQKSRIANAMGTNSNDLSALKKMLGGDGDFNRAKLEAIFGPDKVDDLLRSIDREGTFSQNFADVSRNSQTAQRQAALRQIENTTPLQVSDSASFTGLAGKGIARIVNALLAKAGGKLSSRTAEALATALKASGQDAEAIIKALQQNPAKKINSGVVRGVLLSHGAQP